MAATATARETIAAAALARTMREASPETYASLTAVQRIDQDGIDARRAAGWAAWVEELVVTVEEQADAYGWTREQLERMAADTDAYGADERTAYRVVAAQV